MIYLGPLYEDEKEALLLSKSKDGLSNAVNMFQYNLLEGFVNNKIEKLNIINVLPVGTWPCKYTDTVLPSRTWSFRGHSCYELGCVNIPVIKQLQRAFAAKKLLRELTKIDKEVVIYSTYLPFLSAARSLDPSVKVTLIVTDLPEFYDHRKVSFVRKLLRKLNNRQIYKCLDRVDRFVLLTQAMADALKVGKRPYVVVEGLCDDNQEIEFLTGNRTGDKDIIFYAGGLHFKFGLKELIEGFELLGREDTELWLCGEGDANEYIKAKASENSRIKFYGYVLSKEVKRLRSQATVLVNPRPNEGEYTKYSFPSKTMEYLASGIPTVMHKLDGVPDEYDEYLRYIESNSPEEIAYALKKILDLCMEEKRQLGERARNFVIHNKNREVQTKKILDMLYKAENAK